VSYVYHCVSHFLVIQVIEALYFHTLNTVFTSYLLQERLAYVLDCIREYLFALERKADSFLPEYLEHRMRYLVEQRSHVFRVPYPNLGIVSVYRYHPSV